MKERCLSLKFWAFQLVVLATASSCISEDDEIRNLMAGKRPSDFDFATTKSVEISVDYGELAAYSFINIYSEDPLANATAENQNPTEGLTFYGIALDEKGCFNGTVTLPAPAEEIFVYSPSWTAPMLMHANIDKNKATVKFERQTITRAVTRGGEDETYVVRELTSAESTNPSNKLYTIVGGWDAYGKINDVNNLVSDGSLSSQALASIQSKLWNGSVNKPGSGLNNGKYLVENVNITVNEEYVDEDNVTQKTGSAEVWCNFITEAAWNENSFGYYFYDKNNPPSSASQLNKYIILPNASITEHAPFGHKNNKNEFPAKKAPAHTNLQVQLLYVDENGNVSKHFPPNIVIGFFTMVNGFAAGSIDTSTETERTEGKIKPDVTTYYSNKDLNRDSKPHYIALNLPDGTIVYGVEDASDSSYDDILFSVSATPQKAVQTVTQLPTENRVNDVDERLSTDNSYNSTYCFEDMWPNGGDYDLNDVAVRHTRKVTYNHYNYVFEIEDKFEFYNVENTAYNNTFGFKLMDWLAEFTLPEGVIWEKETNSVLFPTQYTNPRRDGVSATIVRKINGLRKDEVKAETDDPDPFIIVNSIDGIYDRRIEIHRPNKDATNKGLSHIQIASAVEKGDLNAGCNPWYISEDGIFPYAITIPWDKNNKWKLSPSKVRIDETYRRFKDWAKSKGKNHTDWYKDNN